MEVDGAESQRDQLHRDQVCAETVDGHPVIQQNDGRPNSAQAAMLSASRTDEKVLGVDQMTDLPEEQFRDVLDQLADNKLPDKDKCLLVRSLKENAQNLQSKEESGFRLYQSLSSSSSSRTNGGRKFRQKVPSKDAEFVRGGRSSVHCASKNVHSSKSLQDLASPGLASNDFDASMRSVGAARTSKRLNKTSRANSFTMSSVSTHNSSTNVNSNCFAENPAEQASSKQLKANRNKSKTKLASTSTSDGFNEANQDSNTALLGNIICDQQNGMCGTVSSAGPSSSRINKDCRSAVSNLTSEKELEVSNDCDMLSSSLCNTKLSLAQQKQLDGDENEVMSAEMEEMGRRFELVEFTSNRTDTSESVSLLTQHQNSYNSVDSFININALSTNGPVKTDVAQRVANLNYDYSREEGKVQTYPANYQEFDAQKRCQMFNNDPADDVANIQQLVTNNNRNETTSQNITSHVGGHKKKRKNEESKVLLAEEIEGHIGYKDVEYLTLYVNSGEMDQQHKQENNIISKSNLNLTGVTTKDNTLKKREKLTSSVSYNSIPKKKNGSSNVNQSASLTNSNQINCLTSDIPSNDDVERENENESTQIRDDYCERIASPSDSSVDCSNKNQNKTLQKENSTSSDQYYIGISDEHFSEHLYAASDSEMHGRENDFIVQKTKSFRRRKEVSRRVDNFRHHHSPNHSTRSSTSTTPSLSSSTMSGVGACARGYESEREYSEEIRRRQDMIRRKSTSSMPHSEQNSAYNSDGELSSHSMPIRNDSKDHTLNQLQSRTTPSSMASTPKASYADITKFSRNSTRRQFVDSVIESKEFSQIEIEVSSKPTLVNHHLSSSIPLTKTSKTLVSPQLSDSSEPTESVQNTDSVPTSLVNTPPSPNDCAVRSSVNQTKDNLTPTSVPPVIMCDYSVAQPIASDDIGKVTFGFFDDIQERQNETSEIVNSNIAQQQISQTQTSPHNERSCRSDNLNIEFLMKIDDVDKKSFNYHQIINYVKKAWDNVKKDENQKICS